MSNDQIKGQVRKQFAKNAEKYVTSAGHAKGDDLALLVASSQASLDMKVLDIATGGGHVANALAPLVEQVIALSGRGSSALAKDNLEIDAAVGGTKAHRLARSINGGGDSLQGLVLFTLEDHLIERRGVFHGGDVACYPLVGG